MNIFVGCSSRDTNNTEYNDLALGIGKYIASHKHNFIFGGCDVGLMGKVYSVVSKSTDSKVIISMSSAFIDQIENISYDYIKHFDTMTQRKEYLISVADVIIILPGGLGTIDELITAIESKRSGEHAKPIIIANVNHYFDDILKMFEKTFAEGFADSKSRELYYVATSLNEVIALLDSLKRTVSPNEF